MPTFALNSFVSRQTADSRFSHFEGSSEELLDLVASNFDKAKPGYKDGVLLVPVPCNGFFSGVVEITPETTLRATFEARREGEAPFVQIEAVGAPKLPALTRICSSVVLNLPSVPSRGWSRKRIATRWQLGGTVSSMSKM